ncbi:MAG: porin [Deferrisomatales bacterium]|nr:porin [Deferrisomatales bacterium]
MKKGLVCWQGMLVAVLALGMSSVSFAAKDPVFATVAKGQSLRIDGQLQYRFMAEQKDPDEDKADADVKDVREFGWERARINFAGDLNDNIYYQFRLDFGGSPDNTKLSSTYLGYHLGKAGNLEIGRFTLNGHHRPSSKRMVFAERATHIRRTNLNAQQGIKWDSGKLAKGRAFIEGGIYNGNGDEIGNDNDKFKYAIRAQVSPNEKFPFTTESDLKHSDWAVGVEGGVWTDKAGADEDKQTAFGAAIMLLGKGLYATAEYSKLTDDSLDDDLMGFSGQLSYAIALPAKMFLEPKVRYETYENHNKKVTHAEYENAWTTVGVNWFVQKYDASFQFDYIMKAEKGDAEEIDNNIFIAQANLLF